MIKFPSGVQSIVRPICWSSQAEHSCEMEVLKTSGRARGACGCFGVSAAPPRLGQDAGSEGLSDLGLGCRAGGLLPSQPRPCPSVGAQLPDSVPTEWVPVIQ